MTKACVFKQTHNSGLHGGYWDSRFANQKLTIIIGILNTATGQWLDGGSTPTSGGVGVYNFESGTRDDGSIVVPVRYDLLRQGDAMIVRCPRYKSRTAPPPAGFDVYKYVIWFNTQSLSF